MAGLSLAALELIRAARSEFDLGFYETQALRDFPIARVVQERAGTVNPEHTFEWTLRRKSAEGSTGDYRPFDQPNAVRDEYDVKLSVNPVYFMTHKNMIFNGLALKNNKKSANKLWDMYDMTLSAAEEEKAKLLEARLLEAPFNQTDDGVNGIKGPLYAFGRSMTSGGTFVEQRTPAQNGTYTVLGDGTVTSTVFGVDRSLAINERLRTQVATHRGIVDQPFLEAIRDMVGNLNVKFVQALRGKKASGPMTMFWPQVFQRQFDTMMSNLGSPKMDAYFDNGMKTPVMGLEHEPCPSLDSHALLPAILIRWSSLNFNKISGEWNLEFEEPCGFDTTYFPRRHGGQWKAKALDTAGGLIHGSF